MNIPILRDDATRILLGRAAIMWLLVRLAFYALTLVPPGGGDATPHPVGVVLLSAFLAVLEWRRRSESAFWRNFGVSLQQMIAVALTAAATSELILHVTIQYVIPRG